MSSEYSNPFGICFNMLKLRYATYDESITSLNILKETDKVSVFVNLETVWKYLSTIKDLERKLFIETLFNILESTNIKNFIEIFQNWKK